MFVFVHPAGFEPATHRLDCKLRFERTPHRISLYEGSPVLQLVRFGEQLLKKSVALSN